MAKIYSPGAAEGEALGLDTLRASFQENVPPLTCLEAPEVTPPKGLFRSPSEKPFNRVLCQKPAAAAIQELRW